MGALPHKLEGNPHRITTLEVALTSAFSVCILPGGKTSQVHLSITCWVVGALPAHGGRLRGVEGPCQHPEGAQARAYSLSLCFRIQASH